MWDLYNKISENHIETVRLRMRTMLECSQLPMTVPFVSPPKLFSASVTLTQKVPPQIQSKDSIKTSNKSGENEKCQTRNFVYFDFCFVCLLFSQENVYWWDFIYKHFTQLSAIKCQAQLNGFLSQILSVLVFF